MTLQVILQSDCKICIQIFIGNMIGYFFAFKKHKQSHNEDMKDTIKIWEKYIQNQVWGLPRHRIRRSSVNLCTHGCCWNLPCDSIVFICTCGKRVSWKSCWNVGLFRKSWKLNVCCEPPNCWDCCVGCCCCWEGKLVNCCCGCCCPLCCCCCWSRNCVRGFRNCEGLKNVLIPLMKGWKNVPEKR